MLGIALGAIILACLMLVLIMNRYGFSTKVTSLQGPSNLTVAAISQNSDTVRL